MLHVIETLLRMLNWDKHFRNLKPSLLNILLSSLLFLFIVFFYGSLIKLLQAQHLRSRLHASGQYPNTRRPSILRFTPTTLPSLYHRLTPFTPSLSRRSRPPISDRSSLRLRTIHPLAHRRAEPWLPPSPGHQTMSNPSIIKLLRPKTY